MDIYDELHTILLAPSIHCRLPKITKIMLPKTLIVKGILFVRRTVLYGFIPYLMNKHTTNVHKIYSVRVIINDVSKFQLVIETGKVMYYSKFLLN